MDIVFSLTAMCQVRGSLRSENFSPPFSNLILFLKIPMLAIALKSVILNFLQYMANDDFFALLHSQ